MGLSGAPALHGIDIEGAGVKVAVIDIGFKGLTSARQAGELPQSLMTIDYTGKGLETQYRHGTGCAEIVHDMAPAAELHFIKIADEIDFLDAVDYCLVNQIDIISFSLGVNGAGPGDGSCAVVICR